MLSFENESLHTHVASLDAIINDLKGRIEKYVPAKNDAADQLMADKINAHKNRQSLKTLFNWQSEGLYLFGTKQIMVLVESGKLRICVMGTNAKLYFEDFIEIYTKAELSKPAASPERSTPCPSQSSSTLYSPRKKSTI